VERRQRPEFRPGARHPATEDTLSAAVVDGVVYAGSFAHRILGVDARTGRVLLLPAR